MEMIGDTLTFIAGSAVDVLPIAVFLFAFQWLVIGGHMPNGRQIAVGFAFAVIGLACSWSASSRHLSRWAD